SRSVCNEEWLTRSSDVTYFCRSATGESTAEPATFEEQPDRYSEERAEERCPDREPPLLRDLTENLQPHATPECPAKRDEGEGASVRPMWAVLKTKSRADAVWIAAREPASAANGSYMARGRTAEPKPMRQRTVGRSPRLGAPDAVTVSP